MDLMRKPCLSALTFRGEELFLFAGCFAQRQRVQVKDQITSRQAVSGLSKNIQLGASRDDKAQGILVGVKSILENIFPFFHFVNFIEADPGSCVRALLIWQIYIAIKICHGKFIGDSKNGSANDAELAFGFVALGVGDEVE